MLEESIQVAILTKIQKKFDICKCKTLFYYKTKKDRGKSQLERASMNPATKRKRKRCARLMTHLFIYEQAFVYQRTSVWATTL